MSSANDGADAQLREQVAPPGSSLYYCTLFVAPQQARRSIALEAFRAELNNIIDDCSEPAVAAARLGWWHEELQRFANGAAQHPVTRALARTLIDCDCAATGLATSIAATAAASSQQNWCDEKALRDYCMATGGEIAAVDCSGDNDTARVRAVGAALCAQDMLAGLWRRPRHGCQVFPAALLSAAGVTPADLFTVPATAAADRMARTRAVELRTWLGEEAAAWRPRSAAARVLLARARIGIATLAAIRRGGVGWLARHTAISPLRKLWIGWRTARGL